MTIVSIVDDHLTHIRGVLKQAQRILPQAIEQYLNEAAKTPPVTAIYLRISGGLNVQLGVVLEKYDKDYLMADIMASSGLEDALLESHSDFSVTSRYVYQKGRSLEQLEREGAIHTAFDYDANVSPRFERIYPQ